MADWKTRFFWCSGGVSLFIWRFRAISLNKKPNSRVIFPTSYRKPPPPEIRLLESLFRNVIALCLSPLRGPLARNGSILGARAETFKVT